MKSALRTNLRFLVVTALLGILGSVSAAREPQPPSRMEEVRRTAVAEAARAEVTAAERAFLSGDYAGAVLMAEKAWRRGSGFLSERGCFLRAVGLFRQGRYWEAREAYADYLINFLGGRYQVPARVGIAVADERLGRYPEAIEIYRAVISQHAGNSLLPWVYYRLAAALKALGSKEAVQEAAKWEAVLARRYPNFDSGEEFPTETAAAISPGEKVAEKKTEIAGKREESEERSSGEKSSFPVEEEKSGSELEAWRAQRKKGTTAGAPKPEGRERADLESERRAAKVTEASVPSSKAKSRGFFSIQVGAFGKVENARRLMDRLVRKGYLCETERHGAFTVVLVGRYTGRAEAERAALRLEQEVGNPVLVKERRP